ncbi:MAG: hypothetical protein P4K80_08560 [Acidobacteriaceae bacterium]|nr:hypothetical protein [Acidobacteriaceae bacterium]
MSDLVNATGAATRAADVLLRTVGGRTVMLRVPTPAVPADVTEQLGIATPTFQDLALGPVAFRKARATVANDKAAKWELLVSASAVESLVGSLTYASASVLFATAYGVLCDDELLEIVSATQEQVFGQPYVYRLVLRAPLAQRI